MRIGPLSLLVIPLTFGCATDGKDGADGAPGIDGIDGDDGASGAAGADGAPGGDGEDEICAGVDTLSFVDDGVSWPADIVADEPTDFTAHLNDTGMDVSLAFYGLTDVTYTGGTEFSALLNEATTFVVMATDSCSLALHTVIYDGPPADPGVEEFVYTGEEQYFTVPSGVTAIRVMAYGGKGGDTDDGLSGGYGGYTDATISVTPGETLAVFVGGEGPTKSDSSSRLSGGFNGGGDVARAESSAGGGTGGGATDIRRAPYDLDDRLVVAGGGGGAGCIDFFGVGGPGGGLIGGDGLSSSSSYEPGRGGTQTSGGGGAYRSTEYPHEDGIFGSGGACWHDAAECGAGGGGWYGGGAGDFVGGGGGSSYTVPDATGVEHSQGTNPGPGELYLSW